MGLLQLFLRDPQHSIRDEGEGRRRGCDFPRGVELVEGEDESVLLTLVDVECAVECVGYGMDVGWFEVGDLELSGCRHGRRRESWSA